MQRPSIPLAILALSAAWSLALVALVCPLGLIDHGCACHDGHGHEPQALACCDDACDHADLLHAAPGAGQRGDDDDSPLPAAAALTPGADVAALHAPAAAARCGPVPSAPAPEAARNLPLLA